MFNIIWQKLNINIGLVVWGFACSTRRTSKTAIEGMLVTRLAESEFQSWIFPFPKFNRTVKKFNICNTDNRINKSSGFYCSLLCCCCYACYAWFASYLRFRFCQPNILTVNTVNLNFTANCNRLSSVCLSERRIKDISCYRLILRKKS